MRIIAGKFKGMNIYSVEGNTTRPTTDYFREFIFSVYQDWEGKKVLDLYSGTGALGLEAISRGASSVHFVEMSNIALRALVTNVKKTKTSEIVKINKKNVLSYVKKCEEKYDVIIIDPPYNKDLINKTLTFILENKMLATGGDILIEHASKEKISEEFLSLVCYQRQKKYTMLTIISDEESEFKAINIKRDMDEVGNENI